MLVSLCNIKNIFLTELIGLSKSEDLRRRTIDSKIMSSNNCTQGEEIWLGCSGATEELPKLKPDINLKGQLAKIHSRSVCLYLSLCIEQLQKSQ